MTQSFEPIFRRPYGCADKTMKFVEATQTTDRLTTPLSFSKGQKQDRMRIKGVMQQQSHMLTVGEAA